jgi:hypothetical protein
LVKTAATALLAASVLFAVAAMVLSRKTWTGLFGRGAASLAVMPGSLVVFVLSVWRAASTWGDPHQVFARTVTVVLGGVALSLFLVILGLRRAWLSVAAGGLITGVIAVVASAL